MESLYKSILLPLLTRIDAETTHNLFLTMLEQAQRSRLGRLFLKKIAGPLPKNSVELFGIRFPNRLGVAAGFDKDARVISGLALLGFGHVEIGTITPRPQQGNPRPRIFRLTPERALINRMGFPSLGAEKVAENLRRQLEGTRPCIIGASIGRQKDTPLKESATDYVYVMEKVYPYVDYLAVNISSPNTPDLRELQYEQHLVGLLTTLTQRNELLGQKYRRDPIPLLLKISPDLGQSDLENLLDVSRVFGIDGVIATNTTTQRVENLSSVGLEVGGLSGMPLSERSNDVIDHVNRYTEHSLPIVGVGGVFTFSDYMRKLTAGASLIQLYTGIVYEGPGVAGRLLRAGST